VPIGHSKAERLAIKLESLFRKFGYDNDFTTGHPEAVSLGSFLGEPGSWFFRVKFPVEFHYEFPKGQRNGYVIVHPDLSISIRALGKGTEFTDRVKAIFDMIVPHE